MKRMNLTLDEYTHRNLKALAALKELTVAKLIKHFVEKEIEENVDECKLCRKYGHEPNEETIKAMKEKSGKSFKDISSLMKDLASDE